MNIGGRYFSELELVLMFGFWVGVPVLFILFLCTTFLLRGRWRAFSSALLLAQVAIGVGEISATQATAQFWRSVLLLDIAVAPVFAASLVWALILRIRAGKKRPG